MKFSLLLHAFFFKCLLFVVRVTCAIWYDKSLLFYYFCSFCRNTDWFLYSLRDYTATSKVFLLFHFLLFFMDFWTLFPEWALEVLQELFLLFNYFSLPSMLQRSRGTFAFGLLTFMKVNLKSYFLRISLFYCRNNLRAFVDHVLLLLLLTLLTLSEKWWMIFLFICTTLFILRKWQSAVFNKHLSGMIYTTYSECLNSVHVSSSDSLVMCI